MTTPPPGQALTAETVKLLVKGKSVVRTPDGLGLFERTDRARGLQVQALDKSWFWGFSLCDCSYVGEIDESGWIAWSGGRNPVGNALVDIKVREPVENGNYTRRTCRNQQWAWAGKPTYSGDIIAFRLASQSTAPTRGEGKEIGERTGHPSHYSAPTPPEPVASPEKPSLSELLAQARTYWDGLSPDERAEHFDRQKKAWVAAEMAMGDEGTRVIVVSEPVASALADGEGLEVVAWRFLVADEDTWGLCFSDPRCDTSDFTAVEPLVTAEAAAARIAALAAECEASMREIAHLRDDADAEKARADRLAKALTDAIDDLITSLRFRGGGWECTEDELVGEYREALREPKSGGGA